MKWELSNNKNKAKLAVIVALVLSAPSLCLQGHY